MKGDQGYCYIPYDYMTNPDLCFDAWTVRELASDDMGHEGWDNDDEIDFPAAAAAAGDDDDEEDHDEDHEIEEIEEDDDDEDESASVTSSSSED